MFTAFLCSPALLILLAWVQVARMRHSTWRSSWSFASLGLGTANVAWAAYTFLRYNFQTYSLPPWKDPETLNLALLGLLAPFSIIVSLIALAHGAPKPLVLLLVLASLPLFLIGFLESASV